MPPSSCCGEYLSRETLEGFEGYKYSGVELNPFVNYVLAPFWTWIVDTFCPAWLSANILTLSGFVSLMAAYAILAWHDYGFDASGGLGDARSRSLPGWVWLAAAVGVFLSDTLDGMDGKQARKTGSGSCLGELLDHGIDAWSLCFFYSMLLSCFGSGFSPEAACLILCIQYVSFYSVHWEKLITGTLTLIGLTDMALFACIFSFVAMTIGGPGTFQVELPSGRWTLISLALLVFFLFGAFGLALSVRNCQRAAAEKADLGAAFGWLIPGLPLAMLCGSTLAWGLLSPGAVLHLDLRCFIVASGTTFANVACRLIVVQMSAGKSQVGSPAREAAVKLMSPVRNPVLIVFCCGSLLALTPGMGPAPNLILLYAVTTSVVALHLHFCAGVIRQMCGHLDLCFLSIRTKKASSGDTVNLLQASSALSTATSSSSSSDDEGSSDDVIKVTEIKISPACDVKDDPPHQGAPSLTNNSGPP